jgi:hypothetical protein
MDKYYQERTKTLAQHGIYGLTKEQEDIIYEPSEAPENYYCDGEISPEEAEKRWVRNLSNAGLSKSQIEKAKKLML